MHRLLINKADTSLSTMSVAVFPGQRNNTVSMKLFMPMLYVGIGGLIGSILRYSMTIIMRNISSTYPLGTLISNVAGCFLIGIVTVFSSEIPLLSFEMRLFLATGICGGFTTLSSFVYELAQFSRESQYGLATVYFCGTFFGSALAFIAGITAARIFYKG